MFQNEFGFKVWSSSHERQQSGSWLPGATCELNPVFPGATWEGGGSANIAQNHQINIPHRVAHRVSHYCSRLVVGRGSYPAPPAPCITPVSRPARGLAER